MQFTERQQTILMIMVIGGWLFSNGQDVWRAIQAKNMGAATQQALNLAVAIWLVSYAFLRQR